MIAYITGMEEARRPGWVPHTAYIRQRPLSARQTKNVRGAKHSLSCLCLAWHVGQAHADGIITPWDALWQCTNALACWISCPTWLLRHALLCHRHASSLPCSFPRLNPGTKCASSQLVMSWELGSVVFVFPPSVSDLSISRPIKVISAGPPGFDG
jgi:hypothetical protein